MLFKNVWKNMKTLVLSSTSIFLSLKNEMKLFLPMQTYKKGGPTFKWSLLEHTTLLQDLNVSTVVR